MKFFDPLRIVSIFRTLDGEVCDGGPLRFSTFIRTGGCNLRCWKSSGYCDAPASLDMNYPYPKYQIPEIIKQVQELGAPKVTITGGEPLLQKASVLELTRRLKHFTNGGFFVSLETSGSIEMLYRDVNTFDCVILDVKCPSTEMHKMNKPGNMSVLRGFDYLKFVLENREDYEWAKKYLADHPSKARVSMGPRWGYLEPRILVDWLVEDELFDVTLNLQIHKYIWPDAHSAPVSDLKLVNFTDAVAKER